LLYVWLYSSIVVSCFDLDALQDAGDLPCCTSYNTADRGYCSLFSAAIGDVTIIIIIIIIPRVFVSLLFLPFLLCERKKSGILLLDCSACPASPTCFLYRVCTADARKQGNTKNTFSSEPEGRLT
jgi:hypothetical protein